jgi:hypothetical protein
MQSKYKKFECLPPGVLTELSTLQSRVCVMCKRKQEELERLQLSLYYWLGPLHLILSLIIGGV